MGICTSKRSKRDDLYEPLLADNEKEAVSTLLRQLEGNPENPRLLGEALGSLTILSNSTNLELQRSAALTFAEVTEKVRNPVKREVLEPLFHLLQSPDSEVQRASSAAVGNLAVNDENKALIVEMGGLAHLVRLLLSPFPEVQCNACGCLTNLATSAANKVKIANSGAVPLLVRLGNSDDVRVQRNFTGALLNLTHAAENRPLLVSEGVLPVFVKLLRSQDQDIQYYCAAALSNLAVDANNRQEMKKLDDNLITGLVLLMQCPSTKVQCQAALAVRNLASDEHFQVQVVQKGGLQALLKLLRSSHPHVVVASVAAVRNISIHDSNEEKMVSAGFLSPLLLLTGFTSTNSATNTAAQSISDEIRCHAIATLRNISTSDPLKIAVADAGGIEKFLTVMNEASPAVQAELAKAIVVLAANDTIKARMEGTSICAVLVRLMESPNTDVQANCAAALGSLSSSPLFAKHFVVHWAKVKAYLIRFLQSRDPTLTHIALWTLSQLANYSDVLEEIKKSTELRDKIELSRRQSDNPEILKLVDDLLATVFSIETEHI